MHDARNYSHGREYIDNDNVAAISRIRQVLVNFGFYGLQHAPGQPGRRSPRLGVSSPPLCVLRSFLLQQQSFISSEL